MSHVIWEIFWEPGFEQSLKRMGITWEMFDKLGKFGVDYLLHSDPYEEKSTFALEGTPNRYLHTRYRFPDLPAMVITFLVDDWNRTVTIQGAEPVWQDDYDPYPPDPYSELDDEP